MYMCVYDHAHTLPESHPHTPRTWPGRICLLLIGFRYVVEI